MRQLRTGGMREGAPSNQRAQSAPPAGFLPVRVAHRVVVARHVVALWLTSPGVLQAPTGYQPGQFITLAIPTTREPLLRSYSLCGDGRPDRPWQITVKRQNAGAVSNYLYEQARPGMLFYASQPRGTFTLPARIAPGAPLAFVAAGSGISPIYGMLRALARLPEQQRPRVQLHYASSSSADVIYGRELAALDPNHRWLTIWHYITSHGAQLAPEKALACTGSLTTAANWYICGPESLKRSFQSALLQSGVPQRQVHIEVFASPTAHRSPDDYTTGSRATRLQLADTGALLNVSGGETLLEALERQGYKPRYGCRAGACGECRLRVLSGQTHSSDGDDTLSPAERAAGYTLSCVTYPASDLVLASAYAAPGEIGELPSGGRAGRRAAKTVLRVGSVAAAMTLFAGTWRLTSHLPSATASSASSSHSQPQPQQTTQPQASPPTPLPSTATPNGVSGITTSPTPTPTSTQSGVS